MGTAQAVPFFPRTLSFAKIGAPNEIKRFWRFPIPRFGMILAMISCIRYLMGWLIGCFRCREDLILENLALRQQLLSLHAKRPRPRMNFSDKVFWLVLRRLWSGWQRSLIVVTPQTVVRWHRTGFRLYWAWLSKHKHRAGRRPITRDIQELIRRMVAVNPTWGAPRIHGELQMLGFDISERSVSRWVKKYQVGPNPGKQWLAFLKNHRHAIAAMDFFTVPTLTFGVLHCLFVIGHDRRSILHCNVTRNPCEFWTGLQLRQTWQSDVSPKFLIFDRDSKFSSEVVSTVRRHGVTPVQTSFRSPWQNGVAERWVGNIRRELLDHVIVLNERQLRGLVREYVHYYNEDRTHLSLRKQTPNGRTTRPKSSDARKVVAFPRLGGLHHRYEVAA